jgi:hypothetical protein
LNIHSKYVLYFVMTMHSHFAFLLVFVILPSYCLFLFAHHFILAVFICYPCCVKDVRVLGRLDGGH